VKLLAPRFVTFGLKDPDETMKSVSPFYIQRALDSIAGKVSNASLLKMCHSLWRHGMKKQAEVLLMATLLGSHPVHVD
jgi:hypothetical protein